MARLIAKYSLLLLVLLMLPSCSDVIAPPSADVTTHPGMTQTGPQRTVIMADAFDAQPMIDDFPSSYSTDSSANSASSSTAPTYDVSPLDDGSAIVCRDHFKPVDLWWSSPNGGLVSFHLNPPLLLVSKGPGGYTDKKGQKFANAVYETLAASTGTDASG